MLMTLYFPDISGFSSTFILQNFTLPAYASANFSVIGARERQGPHHGAQKSTTTGIRDLVTSFSNV
jgi:hypothetical protein